MHQNPKNWEEFLTWANYWYDTTFHASTKYTPLKSVYGRPPPHLTSYASGASMNTEVDRELYERDLMIQELKENLQGSISQMKEYMMGNNKKRRSEWETWSI